MTVEGQSPFRHFDILVSAFDSHFVCSCSTLFDHSKRVTLEMWQRVLIESKYMSSTLRELLSQSCVLLHKGLFFKLNYLQSYNVSCVESGANQMKVNRASQLPHSIQCLLFNSIINVNGRLETDDIIIFN